MRQPGLFDAGAEAPPPTRVAPGDIYALGRHRMMCGDATDKAQVARLFAGQRPTLVVTSPPYAKQRDYDRPILCWDSMMLGALNGHDFADDVQLLVNLGPVHSGGEWQPYFLNWLSLMRAANWQVCSQYIWDKLTPSPGQNQGRCRSEHEFIFHVRKQSVLLNDTVPNKTAGKPVHGKKMRDQNNKLRDKSRHGVTSTHRPRGSVFRLYPERCNSTGHPAVYPTALPKSLISTFKKKVCITYDPFTGSGTTLLACEAENVTGLGMEISPAYSAIAIDRWNKAHPHQLARKVSP